MSNIRLDHVSQFGSVQNKSEPTSGDGERVSKNLTIWGKALKSKPRLSAVLFIVNNNAQKIWLSHRVTLIEAVSYQNRTPISEIFFSVEYLSVVYKTVMERSFQCRIYSPNREEQSHHPQLLVPFPSSRYARTSRDTYYYFYSNWRYVILLIFQVRREIPINLSTDFLHSHCWYSLNHWY
jgi:hypothetical protein